MEQSRILQDVWYPVTPLLLCQMPIALPYHCDNQTKLLHFYNYLPSRISIMRNWEQLNIWSKEATKPDPNIMMIVTESSDCNRWLCRKISWLLLRCMNHISATIPAWCLTAWWPSLAICPPLTLASARFIIHAKFPHSSRPLYLLFLFSTTFFSSSLYPTPPLHLQHLFKLIFLLPTPQRHQIPLEAQFAQFGHSFQFLVVDLYDYLFNFSLFYTIVRMA